MIVAGGIAGDVKHTTQQKLASVRRCCLRLYRGISRALGAAWRGGGGGWRGDAGGAPGIETEEADLRLCSATVPGPEPRAAGHHFHRGAHRGHRGGSVARRARRPAGTGRGLRHGGLAAEGGRGRFVGAAGGAGAAHAQQEEHDVVAALVDRGVQRRQPQHVGCVGVGATGHGVARRKQVAAVDRVEQGGGRRQVGVGVGGNRLDIAAGGHAGQRGRRRPARRVQRAGRWAQRLAGAATGVALRLGFPRQQGEAGQHGQGKQQGGGMAHGGEPIRCPASPQRP